MRVHGRVEIMRKIVAVLVAVAALLIGITGPAHAESTTVPGTGDIKKMFAKNGSGAVVVKIYGPGGKCDIRWVAATLKDRDGSTYQATGGCYPGGVWAKSLTRGSKTVVCADYKLTYNATNDFWRFYVPRSCLGRLGNKIRVSGEMTFGATPGLAGPTPWLARG
jgi:hypothetical protein